MVQKDLKTSRASQNGSSSSFGSGFYPNSFDYYVKDVSRQERISPTEEISLGKDIALGRLAREISLNEKGIVFGLFSSLSELYSAAQLTIKAKKTGTKTNLITLSHLLDEKKFISGIDKLLEKKEATKEVTTSVTTDLYKLRLICELVPKRISNDKDLAHISLKKLVFSNREHLKKASNQYETELLATLKSKVLCSKVARERMVNANLRLVISIAKKHSQNAAHLMDVIQSGNVGLIRAVDKFDYSLGFRFSTYATWWIRQAVLKTSTEEIRALRLPSYIEELISKILRVRIKFEQEHGEAPTTKQISNIVEIPPQKVESLLSLIKPADQLERPLDAAREISVGDLIKDPSPETSDEAEETLFRRSVLETLETLLPIESEVIRLRYGINEESAVTLEVASRKLGYSKEKIRQIEKRAIRKLKHSSRRNKLF